MMMDEDILDFDKGEVQEEGGKFNYFGALVAVLLMWLGRAFLFPVLEKAYSLVMGMGVWPLGLRVMDVFLILLLLNMGMNMINKGFHWGNRLANRALGYTIVVLGVVVPSLYGIVDGIDFAAVRRGGDLLRVVVFDTFFALVGLVVCSVIAVGFVELLVRRYRAKAYY